MVALSHHLWNNERLNFQEENNMVTLHTNFGDIKIKLDFDKAPITAENFLNYCKNGFYVYAKPNLCDPKTVSKYIGRYLGRPVIATSRIDSYDGDTVTFHYNRHEDNKYVVEKIPALDFISRLIQHILYDSEGSLISHSQ